MKTLILSFVFFLNIILYASDNNKIEFIEELKIELDSPSFSISQKNLKIYMTGDKMNMYQQGVFELSNVSTKLESKSKKSRISSNFALYNQNEEIIDFKKSVDFNFITNKNSAYLRTESLKINLVNKIIESDTESDLYLDQSHIASQGFQYSFNEDLEPYLEFIKGEFKDKKDTENNGTADSLKLLDNNRILLEGNALFNQKGLRIEADSIYYDYLERKIIKSINAKVSAT